MVFFGGLVLWIILFIGGGATSQTFATNADQHIPYFTSIKAKKVNMRSGPGRNYSIVAILTPQPVEVKATYETGLQIQTYGGESGWIQKNMVSAKKRLGITKQDTILYSLTNPQQPIARVQKGALGTILHCDGETRCHINFGNMIGSLDQAQIYGVYKDEVIK